MGAAPSAFEDNVDAIFRVLLLLPASWLSILREAMRRYENQPDLKNPISSYRAALPLSSTSSAGQRSGALLTDDVAV